MVMALVSLTWEIKGQPDCSQKQRGVQLFLQWAIMQGVAMLLQNRYQRQRLYTRIALGKAKRMDVVWGRNCWCRWSIVVGFEAYVGLLLLKTAMVGVVSEWQVIVCGVLLVLMAVGNFANTVQTLMAKSRFKAKMKKSKSWKALPRIRDHNPQYLTKCPNILFVSRLDHLYLVKCVMWVTFQVLSHQIDFAYCSM
ncbi:hypothetical protein MKX03_036473 [Papaver bracteatum]|nr:hypothetical protein MKX03_036473 [Papaver bracteatum]